MKHTNKILFLLAAIMIVTTAGIGSAWAYFTTYCSAKGGYTIELGDQTEIEEEFSNWTKHVSITSAADSQPVYVRARGYCGSSYSLIYSDSTGKWTPGDDGWYYYSDVVNASESTDTLDIRIEGVPSDVTDPASFNVAVVYETTPVQYHEDGSAYADWNITLYTGNVEGGDEQ